MTPCRPRKPLNQCHRCNRLHEDMPHEAEQRPWTVVMDATVVMRGTECLFFDKTIRPAAFQSASTEVPA